MARIIDGTEMNMIGSNLRRLRMERGWSQQKLSNKLEMLAIYVCRGSISRIEDKLRTVTDIELADEVKKCICANLGEDVIIIVKMKEGQYEHQ